jgi:hypothetical protein
MDARTIHVSIVSHRHGAVVHRLLQDLEAAPAGLLHVTLTLNVPEELPFDPAALRLPVVVRRNRRPLGFGANHNAARAEHAAACACAWFCVANPDIRLDAHGLERLRDRLAADPALALVAPLVVDSSGSVQASARALPTPAEIFGKLRGRGWSVPPDGPPLSPDWVAGMLMLMRASAFVEVGGFDQRYHLYYEDVDLCCRLRLAGWQIALEPSVRVTHDGAWNSHRDPTHMRWHLASMLRFFTSSVYFASLRRARARRAEASAYSK